MKRHSSSLDSAFYAHYQAGVEKNRLLHGTSSLEYYRTKQILSRYLPRRRATILDIGGGPGRYSFWLAGKGHRVNLVDAMSLHVRQAQEYKSRAKLTFTSNRHGDS